MYGRVVYQPKQETIVFKLNCIYSVVCLSPLQEGFELSSSPGLRGRGAGWDVATGEELELGPPPRTVQLQEAGQRILWGLVV